MKRPRPDLAHSQAGGVTILVVLMLLVLLTIAAVGMSKNSFREIVLSGTARQGSMARNVADSGIEWGIYWLDFSNSQTGGAPDEAKKLNQLRLKLLSDLTLAGQSYDISSASTASNGYQTMSPSIYNPASAAVLVNLPTSSSLTSTAQGFSAGLTYMGKIETTDTSQSIGSNAFAPATGTVKQGLDLWAIRSDAQVTVGNVTFNHAKESWVTTPTQTLTVN